MVKPMTTRPKKAGKGRTKFQNPPITELAIGIFYLPVIELKSQHIGIYWESIRKRYPICDQQFPVAIQEEGQLLPAISEVPGEVFPLPRFWFSSPEHSTLIQVQRNAFLLNWRRSPSHEYPHYEHVEKLFWKEFEEYKSFIEGIGGKIDVVQRCELTYINLINRDAFFSKATDLGRILPSLSGLCDVEDAERRLVGLNTAATYHVTDTLLVDLGTKLAQRVDTREIAAVLEFKAHGAPTDLSLDGTRTWFKVAHDAIYKLFLSVTDKKMQKEVWKPL